VEESNYAHFGGAKNFMCCGSDRCEATWLDGADSSLYNLESLLHHFSYEAPQIDLLPREYVKIPFAMRDADDDEAPEDDFPDDMDIDSEGASPPCTFDTQSGGSNPGSDSGGPEFDSHKGDGADTRGVGSRPASQGGEDGFDDDEAQVRPHPDARRLGPGAALVQKPPSQTETCQSLAWHI